jgi:hypothetical protein
MFEELLLLGRSSYDPVALARGSDSDHVTGLNWDEGLVGHRKIPAGQWAKLPRYWREGAVEVDRSLPRRSHGLLRRKGSQVKQ